MKPCPMRVFSTGVLAKEPTTVTAIVNILNLDISNTDKVIVEVWDWTFINNPMKLTVLNLENDQIVFPYLLEAKNQAVMYAELEALAIQHYEIRIISCNAKIPLQIVLTEVSLVLKVRKENSFCQSQFGKFIIIFYSLYENLVYTFIRTDKAYIYF